MAAKMALPTCVLLWLAVIPLGAGQEGPYAHWHWTHVCSEYPLHPMLFSFRNWTNDFHICSAWNGMLNFMALVAARSYQSGETWGIFWLHRWILGTFATVTWLAPVAFADRPVRMMLRKFMKQRNKSCMKEVACWFLLRPLWCLHFWLATSCTTSMCRLFVSATVGVQSLGLKWKKRKEKHGTQTRNEAHWSPFSRFHMFSPWYLTVPEALFHVFTLVPERFGVGKDGVVTVVTHPGRVVCQVSVLSESMVIIIIGYLLGVILPTHGGSVIAWAIGDVGVEEEGLAMAGVLNLFLLPIIIFEAGWSMNHRAFVDLLLLGPFGPGPRLLRISKSWVSSSST